MTSNLFLQPALFFPTPYTQPKSNMNLGNKKPSEQNFSWYQEVDLGSVDHQNLVPTLLKFMDLFLLQGKGSFEDEWWELYDSVTVGQ